MAIKPLNEYLNASLVDLKKYQTGEKKLIRSNREWLDSSGGIIPRSIITILGASFSGKTTELENLISDLMDTDINKESKNYVVLSHAFEMTNFGLTLKDIKKQTQKSYKEILTQEFTKEEKEKLHNFFKTKKDGRYFVNHDTGTAEEIIRQTKEFLDDNSDKKICIIAVDHTALLKSKNDNKKASIDDLIEGFNDLKQKYDNFLLILLTQANRSILSRVKEKSNDMKYRRDDIYASDTVFHISDYIYALQNAYFLGVEEYRKINPDKYPHLKHRFTDPDSNNKVSLYSKGCVFVEVLKHRMADDLDFTDLYTIEIKPFEKQEIKQKELFQDPVFITNKTENIEFEKPVKVNFDMNLAFGEPDNNSLEEDDEVPF